MIYYLIFVLSAVVSTPPQCTGALEWSEALMDQYCTVEQTKHTYKHYESVGRAAVPCDGFGDHTDDLLKSLANKLFTQCSAWCVYDFNSKGQVAWQWRNAEKCWNYTTTGFCHGITELVTAKAALLDFCYHCQSTTSSSEKSAQSNTTIFDGTCYWRDWKVPCWYEVSTTNYDVIVTETNLITLDTFKLRGSNGLLHWESMGVSNLENPGATHEMALTYNKQDDTPYMLLSQQLENAITVITFYDAGWSSANGFFTQGSGWANFSATRFTFGTVLANATNLHKILFDKDNGWLMYLVFETSSTVCAMNVDTLYRKDYMTENEFFNCYKIPWDEGYEYMVEYDVTTYAAIHTCVQDNVGDLWCAVKYPNAMIARLHQPSNPSYEGERWTVWNFWNGKGSEKYRPMFDISQFEPNATEALSFITATHFSALFGDTRRYIWFNSIATGHVGWFDSSADDPVPHVCPLHLPIDENSGKVHEDAQNFMDEEWNSRPGGLLVTNEGNAIVVSYMPYSLILKVTRNCTVTAMSIDTGTTRYPLLYIPRELPIIESEPTNIFLGASTNDFPHVSYPGVYPEPDAIYNSSVDAIIVVSDFVAKDMTHGKVEVFMAPTQESWVHRVNVFSALDNDVKGFDSKAVGHSVYATELLADRLLTATFTPRNMEIY